MATKAKSKAKTPAKAAAAKTEPTPSQKKGGTVLKAICAELKIDPKTARRVLRKRMRSDKPEIAKFHTIKTRWVQDAKGAATIRATLKEYLQQAA